jgi:hypothetical protein
VGLAPLIISKDFQMVFKRPNSKFETGTFSASKNLEKLLDDRVDQGKQFSFWSTFKIERV